MKLTTREKLGFAVFTLPWLVIALYSCFYGAGGGKPNYTLYPRLSGKIENGVHYLKSRGDASYRDVTERQYKTELEEDRSDYQVTYMLIFVIVGSCVGFGLMTGSWPWSD